MFFKIQHVALPRKYSKQMTFLSKVECTNESKRHFHSNDEKLPLGHITGGWAEGECRIYCMLSQSLHKHISGDGLLGPLE